MQDRLTAVIPLDRAAQVAKARGLGLMVGNMHGTSLAMAPAFAIAQQCQFVDLDGPLLLASDRQSRVDYAGCTITWPTGPAPWGARI